MKNEKIIFEDPPFAKFLFGNPKTAMVWLIARIYIGWIWLESGFGKFKNENWIGDNPGTALKGFIQGAIEKAEGVHPVVQSWYADFLQNFVLTHPVFWSYLIVWGELLIGAALILGIFTGIAAFFGAFMNFNFLLAGSVSSNPIMFILTIGIILAWKVAGYFGLDYFALPLIGTPWGLGTLFKKKG